MGKTDWLPHPKTTGEEQKAVVVPGFRNIEITLEPYLVLSGNVERQEVAVLVDGGCNTNMLSSELVHLQK